MQLNPYLTFNGQCADAFKFYEQVLCGKIVMMIPVEGSPAAAHVPAESQKDVMHARLIAGTNVLMGSDCCGQEYQAPQGFSVSLQYDDPAEAERVYNALSEGGKITMALAETFWAHRFAMFTDRFGIPWMINCEKPAP
jgi:PhnB protein